MSKLSPPLSRNPDQLSPPLGELAATIRKYVRAVKLGEDKRFRGDLVTRIIELCLTCRPKHDEHEMLCSGGRTAHMIWTNSKIIVQLKGPDGRKVGGWTKGRLRPHMPSELDRDLDRISIELARAESEAADGKRVIDDRGRLLPAPATDRLLAVADRIEAQQAGGRSEPTHSADFTSVNWFGTRYTFTKGNQAESVRELWEAWEQGGHTLSQETIGERINSEDKHFQLAKVFRQHRKSGGYEKHPAWGTMIQQETKGTYRLVPPESHENP